MGMPVNSAFSVRKLQSDQCLWLKTPEESRDPLALAWDGRTVVADWTDIQAEDALIELEQALGPRLLVPDLWQQVLSQAGLLISAAISGGTLTQRLEEAANAAPGRCWLRLEPLRMVFPLPCPTGCGLSLSQPELEAKLMGKQTFFSEDLCCRYTYDLDGKAAMILYDTEETLDQKLSMAQEFGFLGAILF